MAIAISTDEVTYLSWYNKWLEVRELESGERQVDLILPVGVLVVNRQDAVTLTYGAPHDAR